MLLLAFLKSKIATSVCGVRGILIHDRRSQSLIANLAMQGHQSQIIQGRLGLCAG